MKKSRGRVPKRPGAQVIANYRAQLIARQITRAQIAAIHGVTSPTVSRWTGPVMRKAWKARVVTPAKPAALVELSQAEQRSQEIRERERAKRKNLMEELAHAGSTP